MNKLTIDRRTKILHCLVEGASLRATSRIADTSYNAVCKLAVDAGKACAAYQDEHLRNLLCKRVQVDEIWSFVYAKQKNVTPAMREEIGTVGDIWTWTAIDADTKLVPSWLVGARDAECAAAFIGDLASRLANRVQLTSDGLSTYVQAVDDAFGSDVDYGMLVKTYGGPMEGSGPERRYSPAECTGAKKTVVTGDPDKKHISTSYVERQNLTLRMHMRRFTRLTNGFSKKVENHAHAVALHFMYYNFVRQHKGLKGSTPAMEAGVTNRLWGVEDIAKLVP
ncbi:MAG TPA: IS1 family transposase [Candidatus Kapabacteria bacterium]|nr:IS1 family transposase [Candidatus Kapabacteria bacterium]